MLLFLELLIYIDNNKNINNITQSILFSSLLSFVSVSVCLCLMKKKYDVEIEILILYFYSKLKSNPNPESVFVCM